MTTQELIKWIFELCYEHYVLTTVFLLALASIRPFNGMVDNSRKTYNNSNNSDSQEKEEEK